MKQKIKYIFYTLKVDWKEDSFRASSIWDKLKAENAQDISPYLEGEKDQPLSVNGYGKYAVNIQKQFVKFLQFMRKKR